LIVVSLKISPLPFSFIIKKIILHSFGGGGGGGLLCL
jgi:hypothetical protein